MSVINYVFYNTLTQRDHLSTSVHEPRINQKCQNDISIPLCGDDSYLIDAQVGKLILNHYRYIIVGYLDAIHWAPRHVPVHRRSVCRMHRSVSMR